MWKDSCGCSFFFVKDGLIQLSGVQQPLEGSDVFVRSRGGAISTCRKDHLDISQLQQGITWLSDTFSSPSRLHSTFQDYESKTTGRKLPAHFRFHFVCHLSKVYDLSSNRVDLFLIRKFLWWAIKMNVKSIVVWGPLGLPNVQLIMQYPTDLFV